jgi:CheY-like chemotaxis protein
MRINESLTFIQRSLMGGGMARILVAEDDVLLLGAIRDTLELDGYSVCGVANGMQAMEAFGHFRPELIVSDVVMPEMDGFELYHRVRCESPGMAIPFIFISVRDVAQAVQQVAGNNSTYLRKPFGPEELLEMVHKFLG